MVTLLEGTVTPCRPPSAGLTFWIWDGYVTQLWLSDCEFGCLVLVVYCLGGAVMSCMDVHFPGLSALINA